jgi:ribosomal protein S18 acetylase RimI-like enzyme
MLRGWDEGYAIPSLGVVIRPEAKDHGVGRLMMEFLRIAAIRRGAEKIRLRVALANEPALSLYRSLGYDLRPDEDERFLVGFLSLTREHFSIAQGAIDLL